MLSELPGLIFEAHALVSADGMIADANAMVPPRLRSEADWAQFQAALDSAAIVASGRRGHDFHPNPSRARLVVTRSVARLGPGPGRATFWNPAGATLAEALTELGITEGMVAVAGVYDVFAGVLDRFILSEMHRLVLPGGTSCFSAGHPRTVLAALGLRPVRIEPLDVALDVTTTLWERAQESVVE
jgi:hypothetical protein